MALKLPRFARSIPLVKIRTGEPTLTFHQWWQKVVDNLESAFDRLEQAVEDIQDAIDAAGIAQAAAQAAQDAAEAAQTAAETAQTSGDGAARIASLSNSGTTGITITASDVGSDVSVTISPHTRVYGNGDTVSVDGGVITGLDYSSVYYLYYEDVNRTGGAVTYEASLNQADAVQAGDTHSIGRVATPAAAAPDSRGDPVPPPGGSYVPV